MLTSTIIIKIVRIYVHAEVNEVSCRREDGDELVMVEAHLVSTKRTWSLHCRLVSVFLVGRRLFQYCRLVVAIVAGGAHWASLVVAGLGA